MAEEQPIGAEGMGFAFDNAEIASVQMSELSGTEMDETEGLGIHQARLRVVLYMMLLQVPPRTLGITTRIPLLPTGRRHHTAGLCNT